MRFISLYMVRSNTVVIQFFLVYLILKCINLLSIQHISIYGNQ